MRYLVMDNKINGDTFVSEHDNLSDAITEAEIWFSHHTKSEIKRIEWLGVLATANPDEEADDHLDGNPVLTLIEAGKALV